MKIFAEDLKIAADRHGPGVVVHYMLDQLSEAIGKEMALPAFIGASILTMRGDKMPDDFICKIVAEWLMHGPARPAGDKEAARALIERADA